jgi:hypothetical protein
MKPRGLRSVGGHVTRTGVAKVPYETREEAIAAQPHQIPYKCICGQWHCASPKPEVRGHVLRVDPRPRGSTGPRTAGCTCGERYGIKNSQDWQDKLRLMHQAHLTKIQIMGRGGWSER